MQSLYRSAYGYAAVMQHYDSMLNCGPVPYTTRMVSTRYGPTHVVVGGPQHAPPVLLFHGWNGSACAIGAEFPFLFQHYRVYMPDIIGHAGKSAPVRPPTHGSTYALWVQDMLHALKLDRVRSVGISGGGWMTLKLAAHMPTQISHVAAISPDGLSTTNTAAVLRWMLPAALWPSKRTIRRMLRFITSPRAAAPNFALYEQFARGLYNLKHFKPQKNPGPMSRSELRKIIAPTLILMGADERIFVPHAAVERARSDIPGLVAAEIIDAGGHLLTADQPTLVQQRVLTFLATAA